jgi:hypothetical protein
MNSTNKTHNAFAQPDRSGLRKMSAKILIKIQIQTINTKISRIVQNTASSG